MSTSKRAPATGGRSSRGSSLLYKALGSSAAIVAVTALPSFAVASDDIDSIPEDENDLDAMTLESGMPEGFEEAEPKPLDEIDSVGVFEIIDPESGETELASEADEEPVVGEDAASDEEPATDEEAGADDIVDESADAVDGDASEDNEDEGASDEARADG